MIFRPRLISFYRGVDYRTHAPIDHAECAKVEHAGRKTSMKQSKKIYTSRLTRHEQTDQVTQTVQLWLSEI